MRTVRYEFMRPQEILDAKEHRSLAYLPVGPLEWHGPALPFGVDPLQAQEAARKAALKTGGVVMPTLYFGTEREREPEMLEAFGFENTEQYIIGQDFPANSVKSFYTKEDVFSLIVREALNQLIAHGYELIVIVNGHGATNQKYQLNRLAIELNNETDSHIVVSMPIAPLDENDQDGGHATRLETALHMYLYPDNVDLNELPPRSVKLKNHEWGIDDGCTFALKPNADKTVIHDPRDATEELGRQYYEKGTEKLIEEVTALWNRLHPENKIM